MVRVIAYRVIAFLGDCLLFLGNFSNGYGYALILTKMGWAIFSAIFSQTHLVKLVVHRRGFYSSSSYTGKK
jgi:hypothetical protein